MELIIQCLYVMGSQCIQADGTEVRLEMGSDGGLIGTDCGGLDASQVFLCPDVQLYLVGSPLHRRLRSGHRKADPAQRIRQDPEGSSQKAEGSNRSPGCWNLHCTQQNDSRGIDLAVDRLLLFSDVAGTGCGFSRHNFSLPFRGKSGILKKTECPYTV